MRLPLLLALVLSSLFALSACPEVIIDPTTGGGEGGGDGGGSGGGGGGNATSEIRIQHQLQPGFVNLGAGSETRWNPSWLDGGAVFASPAWFATTQVTDTLSNSVGTVSGTYSGERVDGGVIISFSANASRGTDKIATMSLTHDDLSICVTGPAGQSARIDIACEGTQSFTGSGLVSVQVGDGVNEGRYCNVVASGLGTLGTLPTGGTQTAALVQGQRCFTVKTKWLASFNVQDGNPGTSSVANGKITISAVLVP